MDLKISHAREQDIKEIQLLLKACDLPYEDISWNKQYFNIIRDDNNIKAVCGLEIYKDSALLRSFAVKEELRNKGVGVKLYRYTIEHGSREFNVHTFYLLTNTASRFFSKQQWLGIDRNLVPKIIQESKEFSSLCPASAQCMMLSLHH